MKKSLKNQELRKKLQLHKETLKSLAGGSTVYKPTEPQAAPGTTDWTCTDIPSSGC